MDDVHAVFNHFFTCVFDIAAGATITCGVSNQLDVSSYIDSEGAFPAS
jgi:hypothetical protein